MGSVRMLTLLSGTPGPGEGEKEGGECPDLERPTTWFTQTDVFLQARGSQY